MLRDFTRPTPFSQYLIKGRCFSASFCQCYEFRISSCRRFTLSGEIWHSPTIPQDHAVGNLWAVSYVRENAGLRCRIQSRLTGTSHKRGGFVGFPTCCRHAYGRRDSPHSDSCPIGMRNRSQLFLTPSPLGIPFPHVTYTKRVLQAVFWFVPASELRRHASTSITSAAIRRARFSCSVILGSLYPPFERAP